MRLFHFTDSRNLVSIRRHGLMSWQQLVWRGIQHVAGSNDLSRRLDAQRNLGNYVRLCLQPDHPMAHVALREGRIHDLIWLKIDAAVANRNTTLFSDENATARCACIDHERSTALHSDSDQAEILVKTRISPDLITFPSHARRCERRPGAPRRIYFI